MNADELFRFAAETARAEFALSSNGRTAAFEADNAGSIPAEAASGPFACCGEFASEPNELGWSFCPVCDSVRKVA